MSGVRPLPWPEGPCPRAPRRLRTGGPRGETKSMPSRPGWTREGRRRPFRYLDKNGKRIHDPEIVERLDALAIPPAWKEVWIARSPRAKVQATGIDAAGRKQYRYHDAFRAR